MGGRSSPGLFDKFSSALEWIAINNYDLKYICHLLDDFLTVESSEEKGQALESLLHFFHNLNVPVASHKVEGPSQKLEFLGITLDTVRLEASLSDEKIDKLRGELQNFAIRKKCTKRELLSLIGSLSNSLLELLSLIGSLSFACKVVVPGRIFLHRLITLSCTVKKLHHKVYLNEAVREDLKLWLVFLQDWNGKQFFLDKNISNCFDMEFHTDASSTIGYGGCFGTHWFCDRWGTEVSENVSMSARELCPIVVAAHLWGAEWSNKRIQVFCDNEGAVAVINKGYSSEKIMAKMLRVLTLISMSRNFTIKAVHIPGFKNVKADLISRFQLTRFKQMFPEMDEIATPVPEDVKTLIRQ